ncbi:MAG TPA: phospho-sugar mutase [Candidatus Faecaligallichristensenella faecipullorum]|nr:phospho-sugar mutase [Candidatus Faecaligallichristensenella faecipullorum]
MDAERIYQAFLSDARLDAASRNELISIQNDPDEIFDRFRCDLEFGTGGLRGVLGAGINRMNRYVVRRASLGLARYLLAQGGDAAEKGVAIAYDSRHGSQEFARESALVLAQSGLRVYLFDGLRPTPELSFAVRRLGAAAGIVITASHNPKQYNGYKVYGPDGGQITLETAQSVLAEMEKIDMLGVPLMDEAAARAQGLLRDLGAGMDGEYLSYVLSLRPDPEIAQRTERPFSIVYTPLHGAGTRLVPQALSRAGYRQLRVVPRQQIPDGEFPTVQSPNPENPEAFALARELARREKADLILATDPDCDRLGVMAPKDGDYAPLTGNQMGCLMLDYMLSKPHADNAYIVKTIVTTQMANAIAADQGIPCFEVLTGFKFIGETIERMRQAGNPNFLLGFEESYGYLTGTEIRDKDGVIASLLAAETALHWAEKGMSLWDGLEALYQKYGYFLEELISITLPGAAGFDKIARTLSGLREAPPREIGGYGVQAVADYKMGLIMTAQGSRPTGLPQSNVLRYALSEGGWLCVRPSGTEPKLKIYFGVAQNSRAQAEQALARLREWARGLCE